MCVWYVGMYAGGQKGYLKRRDKGCRFIYASTNCKRDWPMRADMIKGLWACPLLNIAGPIQAD